VLGGRLGALHLLHLRGEATQEQQEILVGLVANDQLDGGLQAIQCRTGGEVTRLNIRIQLPPITAQHELDLVRIQVQALTMGEGHVQQANGMGIAIVELVKISGFDLCLFISYCKSKLTE